MPCRIVIVGSGGRLGAALVREWRAAGDEVIGFNHALLDIGNFSQVRETLGELEFDALVNCAAQTNVDRCEKERDEAFHLNSEAVANIADVCSRKKARCIHISTDYVFDGEKREPYTEQDEAHPISVYGASKLGGERCLHAVSDSHLAVRVSWVFGPDRPSFIDQILQRALDHEDLAAIADKVAVPTYTLDVSRHLRPLLDDVPLDGVVHLCNAGACTWQEYGQYAIDCALDAGVPLKGRTVAPLKMAELKAFIARRPVYTAMSTARLSAATGQTPRAWQDAVREYIRLHWAPAHAGRHD
jgi:dTDP-4-dehydrorhamnose reductase